LHPFDIKAALLAKHAQHVVLIHFPIALFLAGVAFDFLARWKKQHLLAAAAYYNLFTSALSTIPVLITGFLAWQWQLGGQRLKGILLMPPGGGMPFECADLDRLADPLESAAPAGRSLAQVSFASRGRCRSDRCVDGTPWRIPERCECLQLDRREVDLLRDECRHSN
jgi:hypothetical protein